MTTEFEAVIGLEVHAELKTETKIFCGCATRFGAPPNTQCCPICMGFPGTMPMLNRHAVELAVTAGLALGCEIAEYSRMDRKQYFYPDLPKAYQISQDDAPLCQNGGLTVLTKDGERRIRISRIHIEEDAGKLIHCERETLVDTNRCGIPLIEIVSEPDMRTAEEAVAYLRALRGVLVACGVSDCRMQEGQLRCDVNISLRRKGETSMGVRSEIKNLNSFSFTEKAIAYEIKRQREELLRGVPLQMETRRFDPACGKTFLMRTKEKAVDYRFLPEPDLPPVHITHAEVEQIRNALPELPNARAERMMRMFGISRTNAFALVSEPAFADYFEAAARTTHYPKLAANLLLNDLVRFCKSEPFVSPVSPTKLAELSELLGAGDINSSTAKRLLARLVQSDFDLHETVKREGIGQISNREMLLTLARQVMEENPRAVADYRKGKQAALHALQGQAMAKAKGRANPVLLESVFLDILNFDAANKE